jgi:hypothetical protein
MKLAISGLALLLAVAAVRANEDPTVSLPGVLDLSERRARAGQNFEAFRLLDLFMPWAALLHLPKRSCHGGCVLTYCLLPRDVPAQLRTPLTSTLMVAPSP